MTKQQLSNELYDVLGKAVNAWNENDYELAREYFKEAKMIHQQMTSKYKKVHDLQNFTSLRCQLFLNPECRLMEENHPVYQAINFFEKEI